TGTPAQQAGLEPPDSVFGTAWTIHYLLLVLSAWLVWRHGGWAANISLRRSSVGITHRAESGTERNRVTGSRTLPGNPSARRPNRSPRCSHLPDQPVRALR